MRKIILALGIILLVGIVPYSIASAGSINSYEQEVISFAQGTFQYKGVSYKVDPYYINMLREYLAADDVDLTAEQRNKVYQIYSSYIEAGVQGGYLVPVGGETPSDTGAAPGGSPNPGIPGDSNGTGNNTGNTDKADPDKTDSNAGAGNTGKSDGSVSPVNTDNNESADNGSDVNPVSEVENPTTSDEQDISANDGGIGVISREEAPAESSSAEGAKLEADTDGTGSEAGGKDAGQIVPAENASNSGKTTSSKQDGKSAAGDAKQDNQSIGSSTADADTAASDTTVSTGGFLLELLDQILAVEKEPESEPVIEDKTDNAGTNEAVVKKDEASQEPAIVNQNIAVSNNTDIIDNIINNTGNNLQITYIILVALGLLLLAGIFMTIKLTGAGKRNE